MTNTYTAYTMTVNFNEDAIYNFIDENMTILCETMHENDERDFGKNVTVRCTYNTMFTDEDELDEEKRIALYELYTNLITVKFQIDEDGESYITSMTINASLYLNSLDDMVSNQEL